MAERAEREFKVRRVVLALDPASDVARVLREAAALAARLNAELAAVFVEDEDIYRSAALPFVRCFDPGATDWRNFDVTEMAREIRRIERAAQRTLAELAAQLRLQWSFDVVRGQAERDLFAATDENDLWLMCGNAAALAEKLTARAERAMAASASVFMLGARPPLSRSIVVVYDGSDAGRRALAAAYALAPERAMTILVVGAAPAAGAQLAKQAEAIVRALGGRGQAIALAQGDLAHISAIAERHGGDTVLVLPASLAELQAGRAGAALARLRLGLLLVR
ncbi:MAG: hypothetical protein AB7P50_06430 [Alphaproteobacteria bacterium]